MIFYPPPAVLTAAPEEPFLWRQRKGERPWQTWSVVTPLVGRKPTPLEAARVHAEELQEKHREKEVLMNQSREEGESPSLNKPGREALMDGAVNVVSQRYHWAGRHQKENQSKRVAEQVACFESWLAWDQHYLPQRTPVAAIKLPNEKGLHSNYSYLPTSGAAKRPLLPPASLQAHKQKSQTGFIHFMALPKPA